jgi:hypothetical protein
MTTWNATFTPLNAFTTVWGKRSVERRFCDLAEEFRVQAAECRELANRWGDEGRRQYEELAHQWLELAELADRRRPPAG